jgi:hypothetical protein
VSAYPGEPEVVGGRSERRECPKADVTNAACDCFWLMTFLRQASAEYHADSFFLAPDNITMMTLVAGQNV